MPEAAAPLCQCSAVPPNSQDVLEAADLPVGVVTAFEGMSMYKRATAAPYSAATLPPKLDSSSHGEALRENPCRSLADWSCPRTANLFVDIRGRDRSEEAATPPRQKAADGRHRRACDARPPEGTLQALPRSAKHQPAVHSHCRLPIPLSARESCTNVDRRHDRVADRGVNHDDSVVSKASWQSGTQAARWKARSRSTRGRVAPECCAGASCGVHRSPTMLARLRSPVTPWDVAVSGESFRTLLTMRTIRKDDMDQVKWLHSLLFPVHYKEEFYERLLAQNVFTALAFGPSSSHQRSCSGPSPENGSTEHQLIGIATGRVTFPDGKEVTNLMYPPLLGVRIGHADAGCARRGRFPHRITPDVMYAGQRKAALKARSRNEVATGYIMTLGTVPEWRNVGLGSILLQALMDFFVHHAFVDRMELDVLASNDAAVNFYIKHGFTISTKREGYYIIDGQPYDSYQMTYELQGTNRFPPSPANIHHVGSSCQRNHRPHFRQPNRGLQRQREREEVDGQREQLLPPRRLWRRPRSVNDDGHVGDLTRRAAPSPNCANLCQSISPRLPVV